MRRHLITLALLAAASPAFAQGVDLTGTYSVSGKDRTGRFQGRATLTQGTADSAGSSRVEGTLELDYVRWSWSSLSYRPTGQRGSARLLAELKGLSLRGKRYTTTGLTDIIGGLDDAPSFDIHYGVARSQTPNASGSNVKSVGGKFDGNRGQDSLKGHVPGGVTPPPPTGDDRITLPPRLLAVPGTPQAGRQPATIVVSGSPATLVVTGPGKVLRDGSALSSVSLPPGTHALQLEGTGDGRVTVALKRGAADVATASSESAVERLYVLLFGYQGTEIDYLEGDLTKVVNQVLPKLPGYARIEDGSSYDQSKIAQGLADPANPRRVVIDWCVTREDLFGYLSRATVRGLTWGSHGFMEPFPGCPDEELDRFESRVWTSPPGAPQSTEKKTFVREWQDALRPSTSTHGKLDFVLMHSCCTGGIGSYADEVWNYTDSTTKSRAMTVLGDPLPTYDKLRYHSFDALAEQSKYVKTYIGPSYFGMGDVNWGSIRGSIEPNR